ncbi:hypothetical protein [Halorubrum ezzemoulense]|uniref:Uncharacterized protein n=1 Tax=Halorubrum ezzemoulense TaxID=337243 RepID=A0A256K3X8_HALEZ|nr:hypothetical protein [Halorubrum ezzemoulense]OYR75157.1 hypothetical protein DJ76_03465 [Halorubrum ezzemoulense]
MTAPDLGREAWGRLLAQLDDPPVGTVAEALADARELEIGAAYDAVEAAIDGGTLVEADTGGAFGAVRLAEGDEPAKTAGTADTEPRGADSSGDDPKGETAETGVGAWRELDFSDVDRETWAPAQVERDAWMCRKETKAPYAPWADADAPVECNHEDHGEATTCAECSHHAGYKWGSDGSREHVHADHDTAREWAGMVPTLSSDLVYIQREADPFAFVDGDDVRDPETGEIHPAFEAILEHLGVTYADVSTSGGGVHAVYRGEIPLDGVPEAKFAIDSEPWGANDEAPAVEIYDGKHVCIATGDHVAGSGTEVVEWDDDALADILRANGYEEREEVGADTDLDLDGYEPSATDSDETTDDIRDIFRALDRLNPKRVGERTIVREWTRGKRSFLPVWGSSDDGGTANYIDDRIWHDTGRAGGYGGPVVMAAIDAGLINHAGAEPSDVRGETFFEAIDHLRDLGFSIPKLERSSGEEDTEEYDDDPREVSATVDPRRAWAAAARVEAGELDDDRLRAAGDAIACPCCGEGVDVVRAVAVAEGIVATCDDPLDERYPEAYATAREEYGAPLPQYLTTSDAIAKWEAVLDVIAEVSYFHLDSDAIVSEVTGTGEDLWDGFVRGLDPAWRESESGRSVFVWDDGGIYDADTDRALDAVRFVALDSGIIHHPEAELKEDDFTEAYRRARTEYGAPLPRWDPAADGAREITPQLPPSDELVDARAFDGVAPDALEAAREDVEALLGEATTDDDAPTVVTALPATGKTTGTVKTARNRPLSYLAPRKELQAQALDKADRWGVDAEVLPVFSEERVRDEVLAAAVSHVREAGKTRLRDRWAILSAAFDELEDGDAADVDTSDIFDDGEEDDDAPELDRPTCDTAEGDHGVAWALAVHVARRLGYTPREIHQQARGLFGAPLPCSDHEEDGDRCEYGEGWDRVTDADAAPDLLVGSYIHAHVASVRTYFSRAADGSVDAEPRAVVLDEFPGEAFVSEFGETAEDFATWLAGCLREGVDDRRDMLEADLAADEWIRAWLDGRAAEADAGVDDAIATLGRAKELLDARDEATEILAEVDHETLEALRLREPLAAVADADADPAAAYDELVAAIGAVDVEQPASGLAEWADDAVREPLERATDGGLVSPTPEAVDADTLPVADDLRALVADAADAARDRREGARAVLDAAVTALRGGGEGCRRLAAWADDGYAHPDAHHILGAVVEPEPERVHTSTWAFDPDATDGTVVDVAETGERARTVLDRNGHGARLHTPPARTDAAGEDVPLVGLDATGRAPLWSVALGEEVDTDDIHDTARERAEFLEEALDLRVLQADDRPRAYSGDPETKDTDGDVALLETIADEYAGIDAPRQRGEEAVEVGRPAAITTKGVREVLEDDARLDGVVSAWDHYGNVTGSNDLGDHRLAAVLGSQHYGDDAIERFCALAGEEVNTDRDRGRGAELDYGSPLANTYLKHMREDQTTQAILRFARGDSGATVVARTSALRDDLPVVGRGQVVETWSDTATAVAREYRRLGGEFTIGDVADAVDVTRRQVRRVLAELAEAGYLRRVDGGPGVANVYEPADTPGAGEVDLPRRGDAIAAEGGRDAHTQYHTWNVRVFGGNDPPDTAREAPPGRQRGAPPSPTTVEGAPGD